MPASNEAMQDDRQDAINESHIHRTLLSLLFKLSQSRRSHDKLMRSNDLANWVLIYLHMVSELFDPSSKKYVNLDVTPISIVHVLENSLGLLQNISLKRDGLDKILHF